MSKNKTKNNFSLETIKRLGLYLRGLRHLKELHIDTISSDKITEFLNITPEQFRKDLSYFGGFGKRGVGYNVQNLIKEIEKILGVNREWKVAMVGAGKLGSALLGFQGFTNSNIHIVYAFDNARDKIGKIRRGVKIRDVKLMKEIIKENNIRIAIISTPPEIAQKIAEELISAGIRGILNFAPVDLQISKDVIVSNVDMSCELEGLIFFAKKNT